MIISSKKDLSKSVLNINDIELTMESSVKLLGIETDNKLNFDHFTNICKKASNQLNATCRLQTFTRHKEKEAIMNTFVHSNLTTAVFFGTSVLKISKLKWKES